MAAPNDGTKQAPIKVYYSYAPNERDAALLTELERHLMPFVHGGVITTWHRGHILAGQSSLDERMSHLRQAQLIFLLISPDYVSFSETYNVEMKIALERHERGEATVIPILLRSMFFKNAPFAHLHMLPDNAKPITSWSQRDAAFENIANGLEPVLQALSQGGSVSPSSTRNMPLASMPAAEPGAAKPQCDVLIVTAAQVETLAMLVRCKQETGRDFTRRFLGEGAYHDLHVIGGARIFLVQTEQGAVGPGGATLTVLDGIQQLAPSTVLLVGIAFGMRQDEQQLGDILVSRQLSTYEVQRIGQGQNREWTVRNRGDRPQVSPRLLGRVRSSMLDWHGQNVHVGLLLSGEKLVDNYDFREQLRQLEPEAIGGEMEGAGLYSAALRKRVDWVVIKAICDWADGEKGVQKQQRQQAAAENAANFVVHMLKQGGFVGQP